MKSESEKRIDTLVAYIESLLQGDDPREAYHSHESGFPGLTSLEIFRAFWQILQKGYPESEVIEAVPRVILATQAVAEDKYVKPSEAFLAELRAEHQGMFNLLDQVRPLLLRDRTRERDRAITQKLEGLRQMESHFVRLQNIFFPILEQKDPAMAALSIFWAWQDAAGESLREILAALAEPTTTTTAQDINLLAGKLFSYYASIPYKEEQFLFTAAAELLDDSDWASMYQQSCAYPTAFDVRKEVVEMDSSPLPQEAGVFSTSTGALSFGQLHLVLSHLPVDFTLVDEHDRVVFFNNPPQRIFPRSPAVIGREVRYCHPPKSLSKVEDIIQAFREGRQNHARFWITLHGKKIMIEYFCLRDGEGQYRGVLEVSQDITELQGLEGERRLAEWQG